MPTEEILVKLLNDAKLPFYATATAAGCDFYAREAGVIPADRIQPFRMEPQYSLEVFLPDHTGEEKSLLIPAKSYIFSYSELQTVLQKRNRLFAEWLTEAHLAAAVDQVIMNYAGKTLVAALDTFWSSLAEEGKHSDTALAFRLKDLGVREIPCAFNHPDIWAMRIVKEPLIVSTGVFMALPEHLELEIRGRSGLGFNFSLAPHNGTIDSDYRGEIKIKIYNFGSSDFAFAAGERIAQGVIKQVVQGQFKLVEELPETERGANGFNSTGMK